jgi:hypothetical protein
MNKEAEQSAAATITELIADMSDGDIDGVMNAKNERMDIAQAINNYLNGTGSDNDTIDATAESLAIDKISAYAQDNTKAKPSLSDYQNANINGVSSINLDAVNSAIDAVSTSSSVDSVNEIQAVVDTVTTDNADTAMSKISNWAQSDGTNNETPTLTDYTDVNVINVTEFNLTITNKTVAGATSDTADSTAEIQTLADSANVIYVDTVKTLSEWTTTSTTTAPSLEDYENIGVSGVDASNLETVNSVIATASTTQSDSTEEIQTLATDAITLSNTALDRIANWTGDSTNSTEPSVDDYASADVNGVTADNLTVVNSVMADATFSESDTTAEVQVLVDVKASAISKISNWNSDADSANVPTEQDYADAETTNVNSSNLPTANSVLFEKSADESNTSLKIQTLINIQIKALSKISHWETNSNDADKPLSADYTYGEITNIITTTLESANSVMINQTVTNTNTRLKIQALVDGEVATLVKIANWSSNSNASDEPKIEDYQFIGVNNVSEANLITVNSVMADALFIEASTATKVQNLVDVKVAAILLIADWANTSASNGNTPTVENYAEAGVIGITESDVHIINNAVRDTGVNTAVNTTAKIQALADPIIGDNATSLAKIANWDGIADDANANVPTVQDYINAGVIGVDTTSDADIMNSVMANISSEDSNTTQAIQAIFDVQASAIIKIADYAGGSSSKPTVLDYENAGVIGVTAENLDLMNDTVKNTTSDLADTTVEIQTLFDNKTSVSASTLSAHVTLIDLNNADHGAVITLQIKDDEGNNIDTKGLSVSFTSTHINSSFTSVIDKGDGTYQAVITSDNIGDARIYAIIEGIQTTQSIVVSWIDPEPPKFALDTQSTTVLEKQTAATIVFATDYGSVQYSIVPASESVNSPDADIFNINAANGEITFKVPPDFEIPTDADKNNVYQIYVKASDARNHSYQHNNITVTDVYEDTDGD